MDEMYDLEYVLKHISEFKWSDALFLPEDDIWKLNTRGLILNPDDVEDDEDEVPKASTDKNLMFALNIQDLQGICKNAYEQKGDCSVTELLKAFLYYYDNDAYIQFT